VSITPWTDDELEAALASLADHLDLPEPTDPATFLDTSHDRSRLAHRAHRRARAGGRGGGRGRRLLVAAVAIVVVSMALTVVAPVRHAVAEWLGLGSTRIERAGREGRYPDRRRSARPTSWVHRRKAASYWRGPTPAPRCGSTTSPMGQRSTPNTPSLAHRSSGSLGSATLRCGSAACMCSKAHTARSRPTPH
jgi:hypothetical protein